MIPSEMSPSLEVFSIPKLSITLPNKFRTQEDENKYINNIHDGGTENMMMVYTDNSVIQKYGPNNILVKLVKAITFSDTNYEGELEAIKLPTEYVSSNLNQTNKLYIYTITISNKNYNGTNQQ